MKNQIRIRPDKIKQDGEKRTARILRSVSGTCGGPGGVGLFRIESTCCGWSDG